jgi:methylenetetrahydrofolate dehydrogenase (NADP+)/methenyltetrahydrofolate cyclohydrolase
MMKKVQFGERVGIPVTIERLPRDATTDDVLHTINAHTKEYIVVQLPLSKTIDTEKVLSAIPSAFDPDTLNPTTPIIYPIVAPVASAVITIIAATGNTVSNKKCVVIGNGKLVGKPVADYLKKLGAQVNIIQKDTPHKEMVRALQSAEIIISGAGVPGLVVPEFISEGVIIIDAGTAEQGARIVGDVHPDCASKASYISAVPGGVGPVAVATLFENIVLLSGQPPLPTN